MNIRELIRIVEQEGNDSDRINRSAFLYMDPKEPEDQFAQCSTCYNWKPESRLCKYFSNNDEVLGSMSCGLYTHGVPTEKQPVIESTTPEEAGLINTSVRCENCSWFVDRECELFKLLMAQLPDTFDLDPAVNPRGCCNAFQSK